MKLYRGQAYGDLVGEWWTTSLDEALSFGMSRGGNRTYVVLSFDEDDIDWLRQFLFFERAPRGDWYKIPCAKLADRWSGVTIESGAISMSWAKIPSK